MAIASMEAPESAQPTQDSFEPLAAVRKSFWNRIVPGPSVPGIGDGMQPGTVAEIAERSAKRIGGGATDGVLAATIGILDLSGYLGAGVRSVRDVLEQLNLGVSLQPVGIRDISAQTLVQGVEVAASALAVVGLATGIGNIAAGLADRRRVAQLTELELQRRRYVHEVELQAARIGADLAAHPEAFEEVTPSQMELIKGYRQPYSGEPFPPRRLFARKDLRRIG